MLFDSVGLGYTKVHGEVVVHYSHHNGSGQLSYGAGFPIGPVPASYWTSPPNDITAERAGLWRRLLSSDG